MRPEPLFDVTCELGEGPVWDETARVLRWVDIMAGRLWEGDPRTGRASCQVLGQPVGCVVPHADGSHWVALADGIHRVDAGGSPSLVVQAPFPLHDPRHQRFNDGACDALGRLWVGSMRFDEIEGGGHLFCLDLDGRLHHVRGGLSIANGLGWSPDNRRFYHVDTPTRCIQAFDFDLRTGQLGPPETVVSFDKLPGAPDGMTVDAEGMLWVAHWDGACLTRWDPQTGETLARVDFPAARVTSCGFFGDAYDELFVTTAWRGMNGNERAAQPLTGQCFSLRPEVRGLPTPRCRVEVPAA